MDPKTVQSSRLCAFWARSSVVLAGCENGLVGALIVFAAVMICAQIIARTLFGYSFTWAEEAVRYAIVWLVFVGSAIAVRKDAHISIDVLQNILPEALVRTLSIVVAAVGVFTSLLLLWYGVDLVATMAKFGQKSPALQVPMYWFYLSIPVSAALMSIRFAERLVTLVTSRTQLEAPVHGVVG
ncbi:MAG: TRAP transporter small permease [Salinisphaera sp.]|jgi:C4-dicarboxylate transporter DctQ subunit|nr:TRAP transporter small permease [Salinisphaera sp.]